MLWGIALIILIIFTLKETHDMMNEPDEDGSGTITLKDGTKLHFTITEEDDGLPWE